MQVEALRDLSFFAEAGRSMVVCRAGTRCPVIERSLVGVSRRKDQHERMLLRHDLARGPEPGQIWFEWDGQVRFGKLGDEIQVVPEVSALPEQTQLSGLPSWPKATT